MARRNLFAPVESIGRMLPGVEVTTTRGQLTLKVRGRMFVCVASHKSAEPDTLVVMMDIADRDLLIEEDPGTYYLKDHYAEHPCVLVRMARVHPDALRGLVVGAHEYVSEKTRKKSPPVRIVRGGGSSDPPGIVGSKDPTPRTMPDYSGMS